MSFLSGLFGIDDKTAEKQDRARALGGWDYEWANLAKTGAMGNDLYKMALPGAQAGQNTVGMGADWYKSILGDQQAAAAANAPQTNAIVGQQDALRQAQAQLGTARGGGTAGANQNANMTTQKAIADASFAQRPEAAAGAVQAGQAQAGISAQQLSQALAALGLSAEQIQHIINSSMEASKVSHVLGERSSPFTTLAKNLLGIATGGVSDAAGTFIKGIGKTKVEDVNV